MLLVGQIDVETVSKYREELLGLMPDLTGKELDINVSGVRTHGSAVIALLIFVRRECRRREIRVRFSAPGKELLAIADVCGVREILGLQHSGGGDPVPS